MSKKKTLIVSAAAASALILGGHFASAHFAGAEFMKIHKKMMSQAESLDSIDLKANVSGSSLLGYKVEYKLLAPKNQGDFKDDTIHITARSSHGIKLWGKDALSLLRVQADFSTTLEKKQDIPLNLSAYAYASPISKSGLELDLKPLKISEGENQSLELSKGVQFSFVVEDIQKLIKGKATGTEFMAQVPALEAKDYEETVSIQGLSSKAAFFDSIFIQAVREIIRTDKNPLEKDKERALQTLVDTRYSAVSLKKFDIKSDDFTGTGENLSVESGVRKTASHLAPYYKIDGEKIKMAPSKGAIPMEIVINKASLDLEIGKIGKDLIKLMANIDSQKSPDAMAQAAKDIELNLNNLLLDVEGFGKLASSIKVANSSLPDGYAENPMKLFSTLLIDLKLEAPLGHPMISMLAFSDPKVKSMIDMALSEGVVKKEGVQYSTHISLKEGKLKAFDKELNEHPMIAPILKQSLAH